MLITSSSSPAAGTSTAPVRADRSRQSISTAAPGLAEHRRELVHRPGRHADEVVLGSSRDGRERDRVAAPAPTASTTAPATAHSSAADDESPAPTGTSLLTSIVETGYVEPFLPQRPDDTGDVRRPALDLAGRAVDGEGLGPSGRPHLDLRRLRGGRPEPWS